MDINRFTEKLQEAIRSAQSTAIRYGHQQIDVEHLLAALLEQEGGLAASILGKASVNVEALAARLQSELERLPKVSGPSGGPEQVYVTSRLNRLLTKAEDEAKSSRTTTSRWSTCCWRRSMTAAPPANCSRNSASPKNG